MDDPRYENPAVDDSVNVSRGSPARDFLALAFAVVVLAGALAAALVLGAGVVATRVPFGVEQSLGARFFARLFTKAPPHPEIEQALQRLADEIASGMRLPEPMRVSLHYVDDPTVNALATLGGNIVVYRGLLQRIGSEDALAAVLAHEIAHVRHRDPVTGLGRGVALSIAVGMFSATAGDTMGRVLVAAPATLTTLRFSREQERDADEAAFEALAARYGHLAGAAELFGLLERLAASRGDPPAVLATHPGGAERVERVRDWAARHNVAPTGPMRPLPRALQLGEPPGVKENG